ncbi:polysaccharide deacetylase family protein [Winogradskyella vincentii]|uniref:Polysaccharide deacetylase family protein n=1 Tax=Winogradskyella vincentii TaxID=2877122 RepID=A0ABS7Y162_9FLAO|nr:polysaccharide deacetylase family protein [Winogradskyella vincentii]MCA0152984.1 polysaccharide deacetylase family protein [Winogradskyella vincentii]
MITLMLHSIGCENENWYRNWLSISLDHFENFCKYLVNNNFETIFIDSWLDDPNAKNKVVLTFDDGYLDNWVYAYPILKKYGLKGTIFVNPEFIQNEIDIRYNLEDVWDNKIDISELSPLGFLNWAELKTMQDSGVMDTQSHSMSHDFLFYSNKVVDIYTGQPEYSWLAWLSHPNRKPYYINEDQSKFIKHGTPIFEYDRALRTRRYFPDRQLNEYAINEYSNSKNTINKKEFITKLNEKLNDLPGRYESDAEIESRYSYELKQSKTIIEEKLNKSVDFICWPGGGNNQLSINSAKDHGYKAMTGGSALKSKTTKIHDLKIIRRKAMTSFIQTSKKDHYIKNPQFLVTLFKYHNGNVLSKYAYRFRKLSLIILDKLF